MSEPSSETTTQTHTKCTKKPDWDCWENSMKAPKQNLTDDATKTLSAFKAPWLLAYRHIGNRVQKYLPYFQDLQGSMAKAAIKISLQSYVSMIVLMSGGAFVSSFLITAILVGVAGAPILLTVLYALGVSIGSGALVFGILYGLPAFFATRRHKRHGRADPRRGAPP